ncbi:hypothetical protein [Aeromicrobium sp. Leaf291]|uniref:hypothetical protein n=1 Tax=Aeromicrobium sp. Leaf291 TaxID=1736325 RepID=UPI0006F5CA1B|nr:hypothetical protein [Aeromicrobium sp. Leaf291]KQP81592.1 hypothetical protein ASF35_16305 [Aeromicrobium sp. Leaf291]
MSAATPGELAAQLDEAHALLQAGDREPVYDALEAASSWLADRDRVPEPAAGDGVYVDEVRGHVRLDAGGRTLTFADVGPVLDAWSHEGASLTPALAAELGRALLAWGGARLEPGPDEVDLGFARVEVRDTVCPEPGESLRSVAVAWQRAIMSPSEADALARVLEDLADAARRAT